MTQKLFQPLKKTLKLQYKPNIRKAVAVILPSLLELFYAISIKKLIKLILDKVASFRSAVRIGRSFPRAFSSASHSIHYRRNFA